MVIPMGEFWDSFDCEIQCEEIYWNEEEVPSTNGKVTALSRL